MYSSAVFFVSIAIIDFFLQFIKIERGWGRERKSLQLKYPGFYFPAAKRRRTFWGRQLVYFPLKDFFFKTWTTTFKVIKVFGTSLLPLANRNWAKNKTKTITYFFLDKWAELADSGGNTNLNEGHYQMKEKGKSGISSAVSLCSLWKAFVLMEMALIVGSSMARQSVRTKVTF